MARAVDAFEAASGRSAALVNNGLGQGCALVDSDRDLWRKVIDINLWGPLNVTHAVLKRWSGTAEATLSGYWCPTRVGWLQAKLSIRPVRAGLQRSARPGPGSGTSGDRVQHGLPRTDRHAPVRDG